MQEITVVAGIIRHQGKILLAQRPPEDHLSGFWEFPGGKVEPGESDQQALKRELKEELDVSIQVGPYLGESKTLQRGRLIRLRAYACLLDSGEPRPLFHSQLVWTDPDRVKDFNLAEADIPFLAWIEAPEV